MLAEIISGEADLADIAFLVAFILAVVAAVMAFASRSVPTVLGFAALAALAFGLLAL